MTVEIAPKLGYLWLYGRAFWMGGLYIHILQEVIPILRVILSEMLIGNLPLTLAEAINDTISALEDIQGNLSSLANVVMDDRMALNFSVGQGRSPSQVYPAVPELIPQARYRANTGIRECHRISKADLDGLWLGFFWMSFF